jgi:aminoglycoside phosphotransferase (APT) family kinase protein
VWPPSPPEAFSGELISHNDLNLDNVVFRGGQAVALIDFDLASPGSRLWDVAGAARLWAPLRPEHYIDDTRRDRVLARFRLFVDSYGLGREDRQELVEAIRRNHDWSYDLMGSAVAKGHAGFSDYYASGALERAAQTYQWYLDNGHVLRSSLL